MGDIRRWAWPIDIFIKIDIAQITSLTILIFGCTMLLPSMIEMIVYDWLTMKIIYTLHVLAQLWIKYGRYEQSGGAMKE